MRLTEGCVRSPAPPRTLLAGEGIQLPASAGAPDRLSARRDGTEQNARPWVLDL